MLGKVLKYEMKSLARPFTPLLLGFLVVTVLCKFSFVAASAGIVRTGLLNMISGIFMMFYVIYVIALCVMASVFIVMHFYKTMVSSRGYLSHTLPVKTSTLINAKLIAAILWFMIACVFLGLSFVIFALGNVDMKDVWRFFSELPGLLQLLSATLHEEFAGALNVPLLTVEILICILGGVLSGPLMIYASIAIGQLFLKHRVLAAVIAYFVIYMVLQIGTAVMMGAWGTGMFVFSPGPEAGPEWGAMAIHSMMLFMMLLSVVPTILFYVVTNYIFSKKLNLE